MKNLNKKCTVRYDDNEGFISFDGGVFKLNETSYEIVLLLEEEKNKNEITEIIAKKYGVSTAVVKEDIVEFLNELSDLGLYKCN